MFHFTFGNASEWSITAFKWANIWYKLLLWRFQAMEYSIKEHKWNTILQIQVFDDFERNNVILNILMHKIPIILEPSEWAKELGYTEIYTKVYPFLENGTPFIAIKIKFTSFEHDAVHFFLSSVTVWNRFNVWPLLFKSRLIYTLKSFAWTKMLIKIWLISWTPTV